MCLYIAAAKVGNRKDHDNEQASQNGDQDYYHHCNMRFLSNLYI